jgi:hypothetical protein
MATYAKTILSGSIDGKGIDVTGTATAGAVTIHTGSATATTLHEIWLYAVNTDSAGAAIKLTIEWGAANSAKDTIELTVQPESGLVLVVPGLLIKGNATPLVVEAFAGTASKISIHGYVNTIT